MRIGLGKIVQIADSQVSQWANMWTIHLTFLLIESLEKGIVYIAILGANLHVATIMHLSMYCPTYPPTGKEWGFDQNEIKCLSPGANSVIKFPH